MASQFLCIVAALVSLRRIHAGTICRSGDKAEGYCSVDGKDCQGTEVEFKPFPMNVSKWDGARSNLLGSVFAYHLDGQKDTWQMYLHGPHIRESERERPHAMPPVYLFATWTNQVYRFENFSLPSSPGGPVAPLRATQKLVGHADAPSTGYVVEDAVSHDVKGLLIAEGQPFMVSHDSHATEFFMGGINYLKNGHQDNCTQVFPLDHQFKDKGHVVNTIDCHEPTGVCFFTVWVFYDDQAPLWAKSQDNDCLYYCVMAAGSLHNDPMCVKTAIVVDENNKPICHEAGVGAVHGMTVGNTDPDDSTKFDILLVFTGKAKMSNGESSMRKVAVQLVPDQEGGRSLKAIKSTPFAVDLFTKYAPSGLDVGGDHAWVDASKKYVWISCFRVGGLGVHMVDYASGALLYSVTGLDKVVPNQYTYTAGIHGVGTVGQKGSYLAIATSSCHSLEVCIPTVPWTFPIPQRLWSTAPFILLDLSTLQPPADAVMVV